MPEKILEYTPFLLAHCSRDLRYIHVTKHYAEMFGRPSNDFAGKSIIEIIGPERFETIRPHIETVLQGEPVEYDAEIDVAGAGPRQCHISYSPERGEQNQVIGWIDSIVDITDHKSAVEEKEQALEKLAAEMGIGIWEWDVRTDTVSWTKEMAAMFGLEPAVIKSRADFRNRVHPEDLDALDARRDAAVEGRQTFQVEFRVIRPNGDIRWMLGVGRAVYEKATDKPMRLIGLNIDITERKADEEQAELQRKELTHLMRVATLGGVSGAIAHELSQPLAAILANAQAAQTELASNNPKLADVGEILEDIVEEDKRADRVIRHLRTLLKKGERREELIDLNRLVLSTLQLLRSEFVNRRIKVDTDLNAGLPPISGDSVELQQVLINLMMNAIDAMAATPTPDRVLEIITRKTDKGNVEASIRDRGPGMAEAALKRIFEPFFTTKPGGLGLGLSICSTIVTSNRGQITLRNFAGGGMIATVSLPVARMATIS